MPAAGREPSMEDILASIKRVIAEEKELRAAAPSEETAQEAQPAPDETPEDDVLELDEPVEPAVDLGPPLVDDSAAEKSRNALETLTSVAAAAPQQPLVNPLEEMIREMLRPILKQWLDDNLPKIVEEHVKREISRITGRRL